MSDSVAGYAREAPALLETYERISPETLHRPVWHLIPTIPSRLLDIGAELVRPGGRLVYAVCSILSREGSGAIAAFQTRRSSWMKEELPMVAGRTTGAGRLLTPGHDGTDGFFIARLGRPC